MNIFVRSIKNFLGGLKYIFTPLGVLSLALIIGFSIAIPMVVGGIQSLINNVVATFSDFRINPDELTGNFTNFIISQNYKSFSEILTNLTDRNYWIESIKTILGDKVPDIQSRIGEVQVYVDACVLEIMKAIIVIILSILLGFVFGLVIVSYQVKKEVSRRKIVSMFLFSLLDTFIFAAVVIFGIYCYNNIPTWGIVIDVALVLVLILYSFIEGWLIHARKKIPLFKVLNFQNFLLVILADVLLIGLAIGLVLLINLANYIAVTIVIGFSILEIVLAVITSNAEGCIAYLAENNYYDEEAKKLKKNKK